MTWYTHEERFGGRPLLVRTAFDSGRILRVVDQKGYWSWIVRRPGGKALAQDWAMTCQDAMRAALDALAQLR